MKYIIVKECTVEEVQNIDDSKLNRLIDMKHVSKLEKDMEDAKPAFRPLVVNPLTNHLVDGQHTKKAFLNLIKKGKLNPSETLLVQFVEMTDEEEDKEIEHMQQNSKAWYLDDYVHRYMKMKNANYINLFNFAIHHSLTCKNVVNGDVDVTNITDRGVLKNVLWRVASALIKGENCQKDLRTGTFVVTEEELKNAEQIHAEALQIRKALNFEEKGQQVEQMFVAWSENRTTYKFDLMLSELKNRRYKEMPKATLNNWRDIFEKAIGNIKKSEKL